MPWCCFACTPWSDEQGYYHCTRDTTTAPISFSYQLILPLHQSALAISSYYLQTDYMYFGYDNTVGMTDKGKSNLTANILSPWIRWKSNTIGKAKPSETLVLEKIKWPKMAPIFFFKYIIFIKP